MCWIHLKIDLDFSFQEHLLNMLFIGLALQKFYNMGVIKKDQDLCD